MEEVEGVTAAAQLAEAQLSVAAAVVAENSAVTTERAGWRGPDSRCWRAALEVAAEVDSACRTTGSGAEAVTGSRPEAAVGCPAEDCLAGCWAVAR